MKKRQPIVFGRYLPGNSTFLLLMICCTMISGCTKDFAVPGVASLNVFNGIVGTTNLAPDLSETSPIQWYKTSNLLTYGNAGNENPIVSRSNVQLNSYSGAQRIRYFNFPDTLAHSKPLVDLMLELPVGSISSLFLTGTLDAPDTVFTRDQLPHHNLSDSITRIRVVNLIPGLTASVNLQGSPDGSELTSLGFKSVSPFKNYPVPGIGIRYVFEVKNVANGNVVATGIVDTRDQRQSTSFINYYRFKNLTMIIYGGLGNTGARAPKIAVMSNH